MIAKIVVAIVVFALVIVAVFWEDILDAIFGKDNDDDDF